MQEQNAPRGNFKLQVQRLGPLPIVNHFIQRLGLDRALDHHVPTHDSRCALPYGQGLGVLLRGLVVEREPIYRHQETVGGFAAGMFGLRGDQIARLGDDQIGRALDRLFDADRAALLTDVVVSVGQRFAVRFDQLHNDSTTIRLTGRYRQATGRRLRGRRAPWITYGHSKEHRPDLKQLLFILTSSADGGVPVQFRCGDGNTNDSRTHIETWETLQSVAGRPDFLYVADSKLCSRENMDYIDRRRGRLVTVLPRSRSEDKEFRKWIQTNTPQWDLVWDRPNPRRRYGPRDRWWVFRSPLPSREAWPVTWVYSSLIERHQDQRRRDRLSRAADELTDLRRRLANPRSRIRSAAKIEQRIAVTLRRHKVGRYLKVRRTTCEEHRFRQSGPGRPGPNTTYKRLSRRRPDIEWTVNDEAIAYDRKSDGMYPLLCNDKNLEPRQVLEAHKGQPVIEKRFQQCKSVHEIAPVFLKNEGRIEALFVMYFLALMVQALIERDLRAAMKAGRVEEIPLYPEERRCRRPTTDQVLRLFSMVEGYLLLHGNRVVQVFQPELTELQRELLRLLGIPLDVYRIRAA
jgi:transposase